jgi:methyl-accepting chemotaxis protein
MGNLVSTAASAASDTRAAATEAVRVALSRLDGKKPAWGVLFVSPTHDVAAALNAARDAALGATLIACTTAGEITELGLIHDGLAVMLVASDDTTRVAYASGLKADPNAVANQLVADLPNLRQSATMRGHRYLTTVLLTDGLSGTAEELVGDLYERSVGGAQIVGGAAGDEGQFKATHVGAAGQAGADAAAALHVFSAAPWGVGVNHGLRPTTKQMRVTKAQGSVVHEIDNLPAFEVYRRHAAERGVRLTRDNAGPYLIANELGIHFFDKIARARAPLSAAPDGSLQCAAEIPKGALVSILDGEPTSMIDAARSAAEEAKQHLGGARAAGVLLFDCVCRGMILRHEFNREVAAVRSVFGDVPIAGFLTYGEIARYKGRLDGWHNATAVVAAIPA